MLYYEVYMDLTSLWVFLQKFRNIAGKFIIGVLIFISGWQGGKITSVYYTSNPIIFEDRACDDNSTTSATNDNLLKLHDDGIDQTNVAIENSEIEEGSSLPNSTVAGTSILQGKFVASKNSKLFHHPDCPSVQRIKDENKKWFQNQEEAITSGFLPSQCTKEKLAL